MSERQHFMARLIGPRPTWPHDMTEDEREVMSKHFDYLSGQLAEGRVLLAGPCMEDPPVGLVLVAAADESEARELLTGDPAVVAGLLRVTLAPMRVSLWAGAS